MKILLHTCCGVCLLGVGRALGAERIGFTAFFFGPNIHPYREFGKRLGGFDLVCEHAGYECRAKREYGLDDYMRTINSAGDTVPDVAAPVGSRSVARCTACYRQRLFATARIAAAEKFDAFASTMMISGHQSHALLQHVGNEAAKKFGVAFYYRDCRPFLADAMNEARKRSLYRQQYCGCVYSEQERFDPALRITPPATP